MADGSHEPNQTNSTTLDTLLQAEPGAAGALLRDMIRNSLLTTMHELLELEVAGLCGDAYAPTDGADHFRAGSAKTAANLN